MKNMMRIPQVIAHCWKPTRRPRFEGGASSEMYTGTWAEQIPTENPLMIRPTTSIGILTEAHTMIEPMTLSSVSINQVSSLCGKPQSWNSPNHSADLNRRLAAKFIRED